MDALLLVEQGLNGLQLGVMLFLMAAGLTLVFGIMDLINLAHGTFYMVGAYLTAALVPVLDSFPLALAAAVLLTALLGLVVEAVALRTLYRRDHLDQVLATFGLILFFNELVKIIFGPVPIFLNPPSALAGTVDLFGLKYPAFRLAILAVGIAVAVFLWLLIARTRVGMLIRAGATNREMVMALGVDVRLLFGLVFALGCGLAGLAGAMAGPVLAVQVGMGEQILILTFVVIVIGGIGSIRGALAGALLVGMVDTLGRALLPAAFRLVMDAASASAAGAALASMAIYVLMAVVLAIRPKGLFPAH
ncbi:branched-chain amino acid ABC transporter permease [Azospirillum argentinense]|uniref:Branched-chain amino acid ABC transporter permease n=1 Tax=Azospirillum argentinense TaxID=2970906 RepID=A0A4D8PKD9_9PROT|nr:branched-chain amino acid ABC transporter permease [Azospirillum argentinense]QCN95009.1 branched-chain amino acid ABC transporter permease [Azospirillum argentinense]